MKKIILIIFVFVLVFIIYYLNLDKRVYVLSIGDYIIKNNNYADNLGKKLENNVIYSNDGDYRIIDLINDIKDNKEFSYNRREYTLDNTLIKADIIFISIGMNDLKYNKNNNNYDYIDEVIKDLAELLKLIRKYSKEKIYIFNYYNLGNMTNYVNRRLDNISNKYKINVIDISDIKSIELNNNDYNNINNRIKNFTNLKK